MGPRVAHWLRLNRPRRAEIDGEPVPDRNVEYLFYQSLLGAWPPGLVPDDLDGDAGLRRAHRGGHDQGGARSKGAVELEQPERRLRSGSAALSSAACSTPAGQPVPRRFHGFVVLLARPAAIASLSQLVLKLTVPGVPDIYQGGELWDFSLVDPDNRRPVDWARRRDLLDEAEARPPTSPPVAGRARELFATARCWASAWPSGAFRGRRLPAARGHRSKEQPFMRIRAQQRRRGDRRGGAAPCLGPLSGRRANRRLGRYGNCPARDAAPMARHFFRASSRRRRAHPRPRSPRRFSGRRPD